MWVRKRLHIGFSDILYGLLYCANTAGRNKRDELKLRIGSHISPSGSFVCLSVRTAFDLFLKALSLPEGSEVIISALTIPDIIKIIKSHGLVPVPVDLDINTLVPRLDLCKKALSPRSKLMIVTHLFGSRFDISGFVRFAEENGLVIIEDCAQAFSSFSDYPGHPQADISMFSFGNIKSFTALGGSVCRVKDKTVLQKMKDVETSYPLQKSSAYLKKLLLYFLLKAVSSNKHIFSFLVKLIFQDQKLYDLTLTNLTRGFADGDLFFKIRHQPSYALLKLLYRRLQNPDPDSMQRRTEKGKLADSLLKGFVDKPGFEAQNNRYWLYPVTVANPQKLIYILWKNGFDAAQGASQLVCVDIPWNMHPATAQTLDPAEARRALLNVVYIPVYQEMNDKEITRLARLCRRHSVKLCSGLDRSGIGCNESNRNEVNHNQSDLQDNFDLLIVGGGINGAGIAREAALRGMKVLLVEKNDFASAASGNSAKLVHGGYRYLESFQLKMVMECCESRDRQMKLNPGLVRPIRFLIPLYGNSRLKSAWLDLGLWLYDLLSKFRTYRLHKRLNKNSTLKIAAGITERELRGSLLYYDCLTDDSRLTIGNILDAEKNGAIALNYVEFINPLFDKDNRLSGAVLKNTDSDEMFSVKAAHIVYAAGAMLKNLPGAPKDLVISSKGIHIAISKDKLKLDSALILMSPDDGRWCYCIPFYNIVIAGTTEKRFDPACPGPLYAETEEVQYIYRMLVKHFPDASLKPEDIHCTWAGLRPLLSEDLKTVKINKLLNNEKFHWINKSNINQKSRDYKIVAIRSGITAVAGGKLTTYRNLSEKAVDRIIQNDLPRFYSSVSLSGELSLDDGPSLIDRINQEASFSAELKDHLISLHASKALWIIARLKAFPDERKKILDDFEFTLAEISWSVLYESALHLDDLLVRRLGIFHRAEDQGLSRCRMAAVQMAKLMHKDNDWVESEVSRYVKKVYDSRRWRKI